MKKLLLSAMLMSGISVHAQQHVTIHPQGDVGMPNYINNVAGNENMNTAVFPLPKPTNFQSKAITQVQIGGTTYDLQTNSSVQNRTIAHDDGTYSATFTFGEANPNFADRGAGYNYYDGSTWGTMPSARVETSRHGWPGLLHSEDGTEVIISHSGTGNFTVNRRNPKGTGAWTESTIPTNTGHDFFWPRAAIGGTNGNTIHCIGITIPVGNGGTPYMGVDGALLYFRSLDAGQTWDIVDYFNPAVDGTQQTMTRADSYSIIADGDNVAIAVYNQWADMVLLKSSDNGANWSSQVVNDFPIDLYTTDDGSDWNNDGIFDTIPTCDEAGSIIFDNNGLVHMTFGYMRVLDADTTDANTTYFPGTGELRYWNENMGTGNFTTIATPEDVDNDNQLSWGGTWALYYTSLCSHPSMGLGENGTIYVAYDSYMEDLVYIDQNCRNIYITKSIDGGTSWTEPFNVTPDPFLQFLECVFPSMAPTVGDKICLTYQRDYDPGLAARGDNDAWGYNEIMFLCADTALIEDAGIQEFSVEELQLRLAPNPSNDHVSVMLNISQSTDLTISISDLNGIATSISKEVSLEEGEHSISLNTSELSSGMYFVTVSSSNKQSVIELLITH